MCAVGCHANIQPHCYFSPGQNVSRLQHRDELRRHDAEVGVGVQGAEIPEQIWLTPKRGGEVSAGL